MSLVYCEVLFRLIIIPNQILLLVMLFVLLFEFLLLLLLCVHYIYIYVGDWVGVYNEKGRTHKELRAIPGK